MTEATGHDAFADAVQAAALRQQIHDYAEGAVHYGNVDRDWANQRLNRLGAPLLTGKADYRLNLPITGLYGATIRATTRAEALDKFNAKVEKVKAAGRINDCHSYGNNVYGIEFAAAEPTFYSGPEDIEAADGAADLSLDAVKQGIRQMLKDGVAQQGWGYGYAQQALGDMGLESLPALGTRTVQVPVAGTVELTVPVFENGDETAVQQAAAGIMARAGHVTIKPDEIGMAFAQRPDPSAEGEGSLGFHLIDDEDDSND